MLRRIAFAFAATLIGCGADPESLATRCEDSACPDGATCTERTEGQWTCVLAIGAPCTLTPQETEYPVACFPGTTCHPEMADPVCTYPDEGECPAADALCGPGRACAVPQLTTAAGRQCLPIPTDAGQICDDEGLVCPSRFFCVPAVEEPHGPTLCQVPLAVGASCLPGLSQCAKGRCDVGLEGEPRCVVGPTERCGGPIECEAGLVCRAAAPDVPPVCLAPALSGYCAGDDDCLDGLACLGTGIERGCYLREGDACAGNGEAPACEPDALCLSGACRVPRPESCFTAEECHVLGGDRLFCAGAGEGQPGHCQVAFLGACEPGDGFACEEASVCRPDEQGANRCLAVGDVADRCLPNVPNGCQPDLTCVPPTTGGGLAECRIPLGSDCTRRPLGCQEDDAVACRPLDSEALNTRFCASRGEVGAACTDTSHCRADLVCANDNLCKVDDGEACEADADCLRGRACVGTRSSGHLCRAPGNLNAECERSEHCVGSLECDPTELVCRIADQGPCDADLQCKTSRICHGGACTMLAEVGDPCADNRACRSAFCNSGGVCEAVRRPRAANCRVNNECDSDHCNQDGVCF